MKYSHIFFDLDHTLWDFDQNSKEALSEIFDELKLQVILGCTIESFLEVYHHINLGYWDAYKKGSVKREALRNGRFIDTLNHFEHSNTNLAMQISEDYIKRSPYKKYLFDGAISILTHLKNKGHQLHIITNGFNEVQFIKLNESKLVSFFTTVTTSEETGFNKPHPEIFSYALQKAGATKKESVMIGDSYEADIEGAIIFGIDAIWFNPLNVELTTDAKVKIIKQLSEIENLV